MIKFTVKSLITLFVTSSALLLTPLSSHAQVKINILTPIAKSCQEDAVSLNYYKQMGIDHARYYNDRLIQECIKMRYHYSLILSKLPWLASVGEMLPAYSGSVAVGNMAYNYSSASKFDCIASQNASSEECKRLSFSSIAPEVNMREVSLIEDYRNYNIYVCPSCVVTHDNIVSREAIVGAFIQWFLRLEKPKRRELMSILGDETYQLKKEMHDEANAAVREYQEALERVKQQERDRRRQELLGQ